MGICIIHLTDIHLKEENNIIMKRTEALKKACCSAVEHSQEVAIVVSGDIAFSGKEKEYLIALDLLNEIYDYLTHEKKAQVHYIVVPGNHDCDFSKKNSVRDNLLSALDDDIAQEKDIIKQLISVQDNFKSFSELLNSSLKNDIVNQYEVQLDEEKVLFLLINSAWMSQKHEEYGKLIIPENLLPDIKMKDYGLVIATMHHPERWFDYENRNRLSSFFRKSVDLLFLGHEHIGEISMLSAGEWSLIKNSGKELQGSDEHSSSFVTYNFDRFFENLVVTEFNWNQGYQMYRSTKENRTFNRNTILNNFSCKPNSDTYNWLRDVGFIIRHFSKENILLDDIYIWPELETINIDFNNRETPKKIKKGVPELLEKTNVALVVGDTLTGKTALGKMMYLRYIKQNKYCIFLKAEKLTSFKAGKVKETIEDAFIKQYKDAKLDDFNQSPRINKCLILDDFDKLKYRDERRKEIFDYITNNFSNVIVLFEPSVDPTILYSLLKNENYGNVQAFKLLFLGNRKRKELVTKWYYIGEESLNGDNTKKRIEDKTTFINNVLGNGGTFIPANPFFILNTLQNSDATSTTSFTGSRYGFLYDTLIKQNLSFIGHKYESQGDLDIDINLLSEIAFTMLQNFKTCFSDNELQIISDKFKKKKVVEVNPYVLLNRMEDAKILFKNSHNQYRFKYPYIFYYFAGRYIAYNIENSAVQDIVKYMSAKLYNEHYSNIIIFVCHFANNKKVIETILKNAYETLNNYKVFDFSSSDDIFSNMQKTIEQIIITEHDPKNDNIEKNIDDRLQTLDEIGVGDGEVNELDNLSDGELSEKERDLADIIAAIKTVAVLGQILQNYPGDIDGEFKVEIIDEMHRLGMRMIDAFISTMLLVEPQLISMVAEKVKNDKKNYSYDLIVSETKKFLSLLLASATYGIIGKIAMSLGSRTLLPAVDATFQKENSVAENLIMQELKFNYLKSPDLVEAFKLSDRIDSENMPFAKSIYRLMVRNYLKYNKCSPKERDKICDKFNFSKKDVVLETHKAVANLE